MREDGERLKEEAEWMRLRLDYDLCGKAEVIAWADRHVEASERPDASIIDVALATSAQTQDLLGLLEAVPGRAGRMRVRARFLGELFDLLWERPGEISRVIRVLNRVALCGDAPDDRSAAAMRVLYNDLDLVEYAGRSTGDLRGRVLALLGEYSGRSVDPGVGSQRK